MWASALAYVVAQMAVVLLHEGAHTITGVLQGLRAIQFTGEVRFDPDPGGLTLVWRALAGPLFSLASGALLALMRPWHGDGFGRLLTTWFAFLSMQEGLGYLIVAPVLRAGDTGAALAELNAPWIAYAASVAVGVAGMFWLASRCAIEGAVPGQIGFAAGGIRPLPRRAKIDIDLAVAGGGYLFIKFVYVVYGNQILAGTGAGHIAVCVHVYVDIGRSTHAKHAHLAQ